MTDGTPSPSSKPKQPAARPQPKASGKTPPKGGKASAKKAPVDWVALAKKIPLPYLGGGIAALVMIVFVINAAMTPLPGEMGTAQTAAPPSAQEQVATPPVAADATNPTPDSEQAVSPLAKEAEAPAGAIPAYVGPRPDAVIVPVEAGLPLMETLAGNIKPLGRDVKLAKPEFEAVTKLYESDDLDGDPFLAYRVRLPGDWSYVGPSKLKELQLNNRLSGVFAYYVSPPILELRSSFRVKAQRMAHIMGIRDWAYHYGLGNRYTFQGMSIYGDDRAEVTYVVTEMDVSYVVRAAIVVSGPRVVIAEYYVPMQKYEEEKDNQTWTITSFYLKKRDLSAAEPNKTLYFFDIASVNYPETWAVQNPNIVSVDQMNASVVNARQHRRADEPSLLQGRVDVFLFANNADYNERLALDEINTQFAAQNLKLGRRIGRFEPNANEHNLQGLRFTAYAIDHQDQVYQDYQYWVAILQGKNYYFYICMLTPPSASNLYEWSRNLGAFEYMIKTMKEGV